MPLPMLIAAVPHVRSVGNSVDEVRGGLHNCGSVRLDFDVISLGTSAYFLNNRVMVTEVRAGHPIS